MSFGFGVGDFLAVIQLANDIRKDFTGAPAEFNQIILDVRGLHIVLQDVEIFAIEHDVTEVQAKDLREISASCRRALEDTRKELSKYSSLDSTGGTIVARAKRIWQRVKWEPQEIRDLRSRITFNTTRLNAFTVANIRDDVKRLIEGQDQQQRQKLLDWLTPADPALQQSDLIGRRQEGTGQWLLESPEYAKWQATKGDMLFCYGIPGAGKTILASIVIDTLQNEYPPSTKVATCYFFCNFKRQIEQQIDNVALQFLRQLVQVSSNIPEDLKGLFDRCQAENRRPTIEGTIKTLHSVVASFSRVFIIVDALDEWQPSDSYQRDLIAQLFELQRLSGATILATSRVVPHIMERFQGFTTQEIRASRGDIERYIDGNKQRLPRFAYNEPKLLKEVSDAIVSAADGMFLLAKLHFDSLRGNRSPKRLRQALATLPKGNDAYNEVYHSAMRRIREQLRDQKELAEQTLMWIVHARTPLTTSELLHALSIEVGEPEFGKDNMPNIGDMVSACCGLVAVDEESDVVRLIHYTAQEFFERYTHEYFLGANAQIADTCITYLSLDVFSSGPCRDEASFEHRLADFPLYEYSSQQWNHHRSSQQDVEGSSELIRRFLSSSSHVQASSQALLATAPFRRILSGMTWLHLAAFLGIDVKTVSLILDDLVLDTPDIHRRTAVSYAAQKGHDAIVRLLLDKNARIDTTDAELGQTPLFWAVENGHEAVVHMLIDKNAQVDVFDAIHGQTPLSRAAERGYEAVVLLLLKQNAQVNTVDKFGWTPLSWAAQNGHETIVRMLLDKNAQVNLVDKLGWTPLSKAAKNGHETIVRMLLDKNAQVDVTDAIYGQTPLFLAAENGHEAVVLMLLNQNAQANIVDKFGWTPLSRAAQNGHKAVVRTLLDKNS